MPYEVAIVRGCNPLPTGTDAAVVIDVIRAFTVAHRLVEAGAGAILIEDDVQRALAMRVDHPGALVIGEVGGLKVDGFDHGNSPHEVSQLRLDGRTVVLRTSHGVPATLNALAYCPSHVMVAGLATARTTARHLRALLEEGIIRRPAIVTSHPTGDEDLAVAEYIRALVRHESAPGLEATRRRILESQAARKFHDEAQPSFDPRDLEHCASEVPSPWVLTVEKRSVPAVVPRPALAPRGDRQ